jgi:tetratricopeptide (TPR) repeat protein
VNHPADATTAARPLSDGARSWPFHAGDLVAGRFRIVRDIAEGTMGVVYEAIDEKLGERRALKCAKPGYASRLPPEARHALRVTHANVCRVFEIHSADTPFGAVDFLTMEFVDGGTLSAALRDHGLTPAEARTIGLQICAGLEAAHAQGLLHRDLKSNNILLTDDAVGETRAVITDFGLAQATSADGGGPLFTGVAGTAAYLAPERWRGERATVASDIFALGIVLHELISARLPSLGAGAAPGEGYALAPEMPAAWRAVITRCLDADPAKRFSSAAQVAAALKGTAHRWWTASLVVAATTAIVFAARPVLFPPTLEARLVILPLSSMGADAEMARLVQGASYDLSGRLMRLRPRPPQLVVIPIENTRSLIGSADDQVRQAHDRLGATHVLRGSMTRQGAVLEVRAAIVDTSTQVAIREFATDYQIADAGNVAPALSALVAAAFRLPRQRSAEQIASTAYNAYAAGMASLHSSSSGYTDAIAAFERAIVLDPQSVLPRAGLVEAVYNGWLVTHDPRWLTRGRAALVEAERLNADSLAVRLAAGRINLVPGSYDKSALEYQRATVLEPNSPEAWAGLARAYQEMHDHDADAAAAYAKAVELQPNYYAPLIDRGDFYRRLGNYAEAEKQWRSVVALAPTLPAGHVNLGGLYTDMGRYGDAEGELKRALDIDPRSREALNNLGSLYQYMGRDDAAVVQFERARTIGPETHVLLLNLGDSYRRLGRTPDAAAAYRRARELADPLLLSNPRDAAIRAFVAYFALRLGDRATAEREIVQALNVGGENRTVLRRAAICYEALGQRDRALAVLQSAPADLLRELNRQPDLVALRSDSRFIALLPPAAPK